jgi:hypothetical protein
MREYKFRVKRHFKDLYNKPIKTDWEYFDLRDGMYGESEYEIETLGQHVKCGIYVGDIVQDEDGYVYTVVFCEDDCTYRLEDDGVSMIYEYWEILQVTGTIHDKEVE